MEIQLTGPQAEQVDWAVAGMIDRAHEMAAPEYPDPVEYRREDFELDGRTLTLRNGAAADDLLYRLEVQLPEMADWEEQQNGYGCVRAAANAAEKIRAARRARTSASE